MTRETMHLNLLLCGPFLSAPHRIKKVFLHVLRILFCIATYVYFFVRFLTHPLHRRILPNKIRALLHRVSKKNKTGGSSTGHN